MAGEIELLAPSIDGTLSATIVDVASNAPSNVIPQDKEWRIDCVWFLNAAGVVVGGNWGLQAVIEGLGTAPEFQTPRLVVPIDGRVFPSTYNQSITFPPPQDIGTEDAALFKVGVALTYRTPAGTPGPLAAFLDLGVVEIFKV
jgi:hypothetical protein